ncbi:MAG: 30S ribosomal protein S2 [Candidatus Levybacteria bacterium RIFCSPLOWO2_01_FULL_38_13]|nr:MAG: 30S ribosomal protein S2 [Candidatus Levybacteria bacterium RIFCSPHIGHO2_01_FULL_41_15]OGH35070.1 MAG: 30S ribosomal protein S2 [Candidatus Levybacteria bacterium RIFCSPLOWO2_01_FULL_38_13]
MQEITLEELLEAGCHFGHQVTRGNPKARDYIFEARDNIHIIDLEKTKKGLEEAGRLIYELSKRNGSLLVLGTKRQAQGIVEEEIKRAKQQVSSKITNRIFYVTNRWIGGTFTNFSEVAKNFKKLKDLTQKLSDEEEKAKYTKKEVGLWQKERQKLELLYGGIADLDKIPDAIYIIDSHLENLAVLEARKMGVTTLGITDTNADPEIIDYPIPANDDATGSIKIITKYIIDAWIEGRQDSVKSEKIKVKNGKGGSESQSSKDSKINPTSRKASRGKGKEASGKGKTRTSKKT